MKKMQRGFTLIGLLLVVSLLSVSVGVTSDILISLVRANTKTQVMNELEQQSNFISLKIEKELRDAKSVSFPESGTSDNSITFEKRDGTDIEYSLSSGVLTRKLGTADAQNLTSNSGPSGVVVSCPTGCFSISGTNPQVVNIHLEFKQAQGSAGASYSGSSVIDSSVVIRNTY